MDPNRLPLTASATVQAEHLDFLNHMNVMWYTHFFDKATWGFFEIFSFGRDYHQGEYGSFALEHYTRYLAELRQGDKVKLYTRAVARNDKLLHFVHLMVRERDGELSATQEMLGIHIDMRTRRSAPLPEHIAEAYDQLIAEHDQLDWDAPLSGAIELS